MNKQEKDLLVVLRAVAVRPALYFGRISLPALSHFLNGYSEALRRNGESEDIMAGWTRWIELQFLISSPAWHWTRIIAHSHEDDISAFNSLPDLYARFVAERRRNGIEWIERELNVRLQEKYGETWHHPENSRTSNDWFNSH